MKIIDYEHGVIGVMSAIREHFGLPVYHTQDESIKTWLHQHQIQQVIVLLIDGMGDHQIYKHCNETGFLKTYHAQTLDTVYPPTTVAATTSILTGKHPCETGWLGWQQYFSDNDHHIEMFFGTDFYTHEKLEKRFSYQRLPIKTMIEEANEIGIQATEYFPYWKNNGAKTFKELCDTIVKESKSKQHQLVYAYWDGYDSFMHEHGQSAKESVEMLRSFDQILNQTMTQLSKDTGLIILADHGHIDVTCKYLIDYPDLLECFSHLPALEPRTMAFYIKKEKKDIFKKLFLSYFKNDFKLFTREEAVSMKLFGTGTSHPKFEDFLGDFVACAISSTDLYYDRSIIVKGSHAGFTEEELQIPLILYHGVA